MTTDDDEARVHRFITIVESARRTARTGLWTFAEWRAELPARLRPHEVTDAQWRAIDALFFRGGMSSE